MTDHIEDGGPAFAQEQWNPDREMFMVTGGMTLRDYFAAKALQTVIKQCANDTMHGMSRPDYFAGRAYELADAMLKARKS